MKEYDASPQHHNTSLYIIIFILCSTLIIAIIWVFYHVKRTSALKKNQLTILTERKNYLKNTINYIQTSDLNKTLHWDNYFKSEECINHYFYQLADKLKIIYPKINLLEIRLCALILMNFKLEYCAQQFNTSIDSMKHRKSRLARNLGTTAADMHDFLFHLAYAKDVFEGRIIELSPSSV